MALAKKDSGMPEKVLKFHITLWTCIAVFAVFVIAIFFFLKSFEKNDPILYTNVPISGAHAPRTPKAPVDDNVPPVEAELSELPQIEPSDVVCETRDLQQNSLENSQPTGTEEFLEEQEVENNANELVGRKRPLKKNCKLRPDPRKITITGAVAAVPPCDVSECQGPAPKARDLGVKLGDGVYLAYNENHNGSISMHYCRERINTLNGVMAYICPQREIPAFHYKRDGGIVQLTKNLGQCMQSKFQTDRMHFYLAWLEFFKVLASTNGTLVLLDGSNLAPPPKVSLLLFSKHSITVAAPGTEYKVDLYESIGILPEAFDRSDMERQKLIRSCQEHGVFLDI
ncbi:Immune mapped protein 2 [Babesia duncani]|uniref:Immune mapped protein 2 n=1 Tax=Babesia duncani TaxID=323732 RepID=A0AAD9PMM2_9APIC|nr:Immune mapped protein 2 [Babesia duncani]